MIPANIELSGLEVSLSNTMSRELILSYAFGQEPMGMMWRMIGTGVFICLLPKIGEWVAAQVVYLNLLVKHWLMS